jgi:hypothetical protein
LNVGQSAEIVAPASFVVNDPGEYLVTVTISADGDGVPGNDITMLRFFVGDLPRWFRHDDNEANTHINPSQGTSWGVAYIPTSYPARIESLRVEFGGDGSAAVAIYMNDVDGVPTGEAVWTATPDVATGWNVIPVNPPVDLFEGQTFTAATEYDEDAISTGKDDDPPNQAGIAHMSGVGWQGFQGTWVEDLGGNWCIQVYVDTSSAVPAWPVFEASSEVLVFGDVPTDQPASMNFWVYNSGGGDDLIISATSIVPPGAAAVYTFEPETFTVAAGDSEEVIVTFAPTSVGQNYNGLVTITNNSINDPAYRITVTGTGDDPISADESGSGLPAEFAMAQNYPNPFNPSTHIQFALPVQSEVRLTVFNTLGQQVATLFTGIVEAGVHSFEFDAADYTAGLYFYKLEAGSFTQTRKMMLLK